MSTSVQIAVGSIAAAASPSCASHIVHVFYPIASLEDLVLCKKIPWISNQLQLMAEPRSLCNRVESRDGTPIVGD